MIGGSRWSLPARLRDTRLILLMLAALALLPVFGHPSVRVVEPVREYLFVVDITQSMNVRDYTLGGRSIDRLNFVKMTLIRALPELPCGSSVGLGLFTAWQTAVLFNPIEVCRHRREIDDAIRSIDWRMAWAPQSNIARGINDALAQISTTNGQVAALVFLTDGDEAPPTDGKLPAVMETALQKRPRGLLVGVGDRRPSAIPLFNQGGNMAGYFQRGGQPMLSGLQEDYLRKLARRINLDYHRLQAPEDLLNPLQSGRYANARPVNREISWAFGAVALALVAAAYLVTPLAAIRGLDRSPPASQPAPQGVGSFWSRRARL